MTLKDLSPQTVWHYFGEICQVPRPSKHEGQIIEYLINFGKRHGLETKCDETGNVLISKKATQGFENRKTTVLQSHIDMVCEKNSSSTHNFMKDPIVPFVQDEWVKAEGTTLGADDGIGMAVQLAILAASDLQHGAIECLFTVDEETGLSGAFGLKEGFFTGKILINLDSEEEGEIFIGCAGGMDCSGRFDYEYSEVPEGWFAFRVAVSGLQGGHSGDDIHRGLGNANKLLTRFLHTITRETGFRLAAIDGGNLRNAIAREAWAEGVVPFEKKEDVRVLLNICASEFENEYKGVEAGLRLTLETVDTPSCVFKESLQSRLLHALYAMPHGVIAMSRDIPGLTETSTNLASVKMKDDGIWLATSQRSSVESEKRDIANMVESVFRLAGAECFHSDGYPGWAPNTDSAILKTAVDTYQKLFGTKPEVKAIHAGLECGLFLEKYPGLDMISVGPTLRGVHSPDERLLISSVPKFWEHLLEMLAQIPENKG
ncbi:MAG: aminoacyl-histidine dipeptidase [Cytophagaceae bacterium]|jgi:dipeptidase D|nr:aminoacyl-histidine dipeptidase [Cytophagaceae bacterium]